MLRKISSLFVAQGEIGNTIVSDGNDPHFCIDTDINSLTFLFVAAVLDAEEE